MLKVSVETSNDLMFLYIENLMKIAMVFFILILGCSTAPLPVPVETKVKQIKKQSITEDENDRKIQDILRRYCAYEKDYDKELCPPKKIPRKK